LWTREPSDVVCQALNDEEYEKRIQFISQTLKQIGKQLLQEATRAVQMDQGASRWMDSWRGLAEEASKQLEQDAVELHKEVQKEVKNQVGQPDVGLHKGLF